MTEGNKIILFSTKISLAFFAGLIFLIPAIIVAQDRQTLERDKRRIEQEMALISQLLQETQTSAEMNLGQLMIINNSISTRQGLINNITNEIAISNRNIAATNKDKELLEEELNELKESYASMIYYAYRNRSAYQRMMFIFSSRDFNQAYLRMKYLQQLARHRQLQAEKIEETTGKLLEKIAELEAKKTEQQALLAEQRSEMEVLNKEREQQAQNVEQLRSRERELKQQLQEQQRVARELQSAIEQVIAEERRRAAEAARQQGRPASEAHRLTPGEQTISNNFAENKGKLPWPIERGIITGSFGEQPHPVLRGITIVNNGIDITTTQGSRARAIFEGTVSRVVNIPGGYAVIIRHGEYLTVYSNLSEVFVTAGQKVAIRDEVGITATDPREARTFVHLEVWHGNNKQNPADWIVRQR